MKKNVNRLIDDIRKIVSRHQLAEGAYARYTINDGTRDMGVNAYGCANAANILYTIGDFPRDMKERQAFIDVLRGMQDPETGLFDEGSHHNIHTTAHCLGSLELFDVGPLYRLSAFDAYRSKEGLYQFLEELEWNDRPWQGSHKGAGLFAAMNLAGEALPEWNDWYFKWLWEEVDPETGFWRKGCIKSLYTSMGGSFHYLFNHECFRRPIRYPDKMIDSCLDLFYNKKMGENFGKQIGFVEADWVYCISRSLRQCPHRFEECVETVTGFANDYLDFLMSLNPDTDLKLDDLHSLFGAVCCIAELQSFLPGAVYTDKPLKLVLDRRPFI